MDFLKRNVGPLNKEVFARLHKALVIPNGLNCNDYFESNCYGKTRSNHSFKLRQPLARVNCFLHSFFVRIIKQWNALPKESARTGFQHFSKVNLESIVKFCKFFFSHFLMIFKFYIVAYLFYILCREHPR